MSSNMLKDSQDALNALRGKLKNLEEAYDQFEEVRFDSMLVDLESDKLRKASDLITEASNELSKSHSLIEEMVGIYEDAVGLFNTELIDGRVVDDIFIELEESFDKANNLAVENEECDEKIEAVADTVTKIYDSLDDEDNMEVVKSRAAKGVDNIAGTNP